MDDFHFNSRCMDHPRTNNRAGPHGDWDRIPASASARIIAPAVLAIPDFESDLVSERVLSVLCGNSFLREKSLSPRRAPKRSLLPLSPRRTQVRLKPLL